MVGCGGLCRRANGSWVVGFTSNLEICNLVVAELWGAYYALKLAWEIGFKQIILEFDSKYLVENILRSDPSSMKFQPLFNKIRSFVQMEWQMEVFTHAEKAISVRTGLPIIVLISIWVIIR